MPGTSFSFRDEKSAAQRGDGLTPGHTAREANPSVPASGLGGLGGWEKLGGSPVHLCGSPTSRVTELALTVERLQDQNLEKDQLNKALSEKLEALVRRGVGREGLDTG